MLHNFNIREQAKGPNIPITKIFTAVVNKNNSLLMIHMYWDGKGSFYNAPDFNGPLISALSVTPGNKTNLISPPFYVFLLQVLGTLLDPTEIIKGPSLQGYRQLSFLLVFFK